jgi:hypothetical protein
MTTQDDGTLFTDPTSTIVDPNKNWLEELVGEGKKFADPAALARAKAESDAHIARLEREQAGVRAELEKRITMEELLTKLSAQKTTAPATSGTSEDTTEDKGSGTAAQQTALTPEQIQEMVQQGIATAVSQSVQKANFDMVKDTLIKTLGPNYAETLAKKAQDLGVGPKFLDDLAKTQPKAFLKLVEVEKPAETSTGTPRMGTQMDSGKNSGPADPDYKGQSYFLNLQKTDPKTFWNPKTQIQMHEMAMKDPSKYFSS